MNRTIFYDKELEKETFHLTSLSINEEAKLAEIFGFTFNINVFDFLETEITFRTSNEFMDNEINDDEKPLNLPYSAKEIVDQEVKDYINQYSDREENPINDQITDIKDAINELDDEMNCTASEFRALLKRGLQKLSDRIDDRKNKLETDMEDLINDFQDETGYVVYAVKLMKEDERDDDGFLTILINERE